MTVQAINLGDTSADAVPVPPVSLLGTVFMAVTYMISSSITDENQGPYEIGLVAAYPNTVVRVTITQIRPVTVTFEGTSYNSGDVVTIALGQYQSAQVRTLTDRI